MRYTNPRLLYYLLYFTGSEMSSPMASFSSIFAFDASNILSSIKI